MISDKELLKIWEKHNDSARNYWRFMVLPQIEKQRIFALISGIEKEIIL